MSANVVDKDDVFLKLQDQSVLIIIFKWLQFEHNINVGHLAKKWNIMHLGWMVDHDMQYQNEITIDIENANLLHWNGPYKPWLSTTVSEKKGYYIKYWIPYLPKQLIPKHIADWDQRWISLPHIEIIDIATICDENLIENVYKLIDFVLMQRI
eukprot:292555_1